MVIAVDAENAVCLTCNRFIGTKVWLCGLLDLYSCQPEKADVLSTLSLGKNIQHNRLDVSWIAFGDPCLRMRVLVGTYFVDASRSGGATGSQESTVNDFGDTIRAVER
ncbi:hypothetical protein Pla52n_11260 [Stieleria varia]|uniref:Uncharacterized protein n=1 Tax=Stieleria varia TaxID=2528005 RepID=A0A5C6B8Z0_9BACT|nr:hypothetical protein Pla52n_11260 [Stieleria varia]